jgi:hypothetical protein
MLDDGIMMLYPTAISPICLKNSCVQWLVLSHQAWEHTIYLKDPTTYVTSTGSLALG